MSLYKKAYTNATLGDFFLSRLWRQTVKDKYYFGARATVCNNLTDYNLPCAAFIRYILQIISEIVPMHSQYGRQLHGVKSLNASIMG